MDAETLRTILEAQTKAQQQMFTELIKRKEKMASASHPAVPTAPVATADFSRILYRHACLISCTIRKMGAHSRSGTTARRTSSQRTVLRWTTQQKLD
ncbi:hypothetical protein RB195_023129 [Necator americanus]|uniref:Uncharacterized protein n=1 Tax=Necator americanus TaxID=51031 RepID=A0ABR1EKJ2_NECAM